MLIRLITLAALIAATACGETSTSADKEPFRFAELFPLREQMAEIPPLEPYPTRDGATLSFRRYPAASTLHVILMHGSSAHSGYLHGFGRYLSNRDIASVYAPDLRGHGPAPQRRGDIDFIGQLEQDIADLIAHIRTEAGDEAHFIVGGHSSGGGMALRFGGSEYGRLASGILLLAPYLGHDAPMVRRNAGGWANPSIARIIGLSVLNGFGITRYNGARVLRFNLPGKYRTGYETTEYSFRLMTGMHPADYQDALHRTAAPLLLLVGTEDEAFHADKFEAGILPYKPDARVVLIEGGSHLGIVMSEPAMAEAGRWIDAIRN